MTEVETPNPNHPSLHRSFQGSNSNYYPERYSGDFPQHLQGQPRSVSVGQNLSTQSQPDSTPQLISETGGDTILDESVIPEPGFNAKTLFILLGVGFFVWMLMRQ